MSSGCVFDVLADVTDPPGRVSALKTGLVVGSKRGSYDSPAFGIAPGALVRFDVVPSKGGPCTSLSGQLDLDGSPYARTVQEFPPGGAGFHLETQAGP
jgi:hypothetical protein